MTVYESQLAFLLLEEYFGPIVTRVCEPLKWGPKTLKLLVDPVHSPPSTVSFILSFESVFLNYVVELTNSCIFVGETSAEYSHKLQFCLLQKPRRKSSILRLLFTDQ